MKTATSTKRWLGALSLGIGLLLTPALHGDETEIQGLAARIDQRIAAGWDKGIMPAPLADDAEFCRRIHLDLAGRIPSLIEVRDFLDDERPNKRRLWVERILQPDREDPAYRDAYSNHFANVWRAWLLAQANQQARSQQPNLEHWLRQGLRANLGYDVLVRDLLTQDPANLNRRSDPTKGNATAFYLANEFQPENLAGSTARLFLGMKLECAQCHDHPFGAWTRNQFWEYAAFFTDVPAVLRPNLRGPQPARGEIKIVGTDRVVKARFLDGSEPRWKDAGSRPTLVDWLTAADNPFFARALVNRLWSYFFGVGLVDALDAPSEEQPASHRALLEELAQEFVAHRYDLKFLIRVIVASGTYQRASLVPQAGQSDLRQFARMPLRGLSPEQLFDSLAVTTEYHDTTPVDAAANPFGRLRTARAQFLAKFPLQEPRTDYQTSILQALYLMNNHFIAERTSVDQNQTLATLANQQTSTARKVESLYLVVLSREPRPEERARSVAYVDGGGPTGDSRKALADLFWVLLNSPEFLLNH